MNQATIDVKNHENVYKSNQISKGMKGTYSTDMVDFEKSEMYRFLDENYDFDATKLILTNHKEENHPSVRQATYRGIGKGIQEFLKANRIVGFYDSDLAEFCKNNTTANRVNEFIEGLELNLDGVLPYSKDVAETFGMFAYNESRTKFIDTFDK